MPYPLRRERFWFLRSEQRVSTFTGLFLPADSSRNCSIATTPATPPIHASLDYGRSMCLRSRKTLKS